MLYQFIVIAFIIFLLETLDDFFNYLIEKLHLLISINCFTNIQIDMSEEILKLENSELNNEGTGTFIQRLTNDASSLDELFHCTLLYFSSTLKHFGIFVAIFLINKIVFIYIVLALIIESIVEKNRSDYKIKNDKKYKEANDKTIGFEMEFIRGTKDIKMLSAENSICKMFKSRINTLNNLKYKFGIANEHRCIFNGIITNLLDFLLLVLFALLIKSNHLLITNALILYNYSKDLQNVSWHLSCLFDYYKSLNLAIVRVFEVIDDNKFKKEKFGTKHLNKVEGNFEFKKVCFAYEEKNVLNDLSFKVNANETVAFVGKSGSGKTTIFNLLCKMYDVNDGIITIDNVNINELDKDSIRNNITIISQSPYLFNMSIKDNLKLVKSNITDKEIEEACSLACIDEFINRLPNKYDTIIGEGGVNLSGGQKQRLAIARALVQKTEIILFDEATSALDNETQEKIVEALNNMKREYTILIIAHRLSTIINADRIIYIDDGKVLSEGTHEELLKKCKEYKKLYQKEIAKK